MAQTIKLKRSATQGAAPTTSNLALGEVAINTYDGKMYIKKDVGGTESIVEIGGSGANTVSYLEAGMIEYEYTATSNQTTFSGSDSNSATLSYTANSIMVFLNGVLQDDGVDYTATNGTSVVFSSALTANDEVRIVAFTNVTTSAGLNNPTKLDAITTVNAQAAYSLTLNSSAYTPSSQNALIVSLNGITQEPGDSFTISGSTITFSPALVTGDVVDYIVDMGRAVTIGEYSGDLAVGGELEVTGDIIGDLRGATLFKAQAGESLAKGDVVYISGISGNTTVVSKADADDAAKMPAFGLVAAAASSGNPVDIYTFGELSGLDTSSFSEGDELFVSTTAGTLTNSAPTGESSKLQKIAKVTRSDNSAGSVFIMGAGRSNAVPNLDDGDIFIGNASNQAVTASLNTKIEDYLDGGTSTPVFSTINSGNITTTGYIAGPSTFTIDPAAVGDNTGTLVVAGNLQVDGTTTTINSTTMTVDDLNITLASGAANAAAANGAGITVDGASATLTYNGTNDDWNFNKTLNLTGDLNITDDPFPRITLSDSGGTNQKMLLDVSGGYSAVTAWDNTSHGTLDFKSYDGTTTRVNMRIDVTGNVGIKQSSPSTYTGAGARSLVIGNHTGFEGITLATSTTATGNFAFSDGSSGTDQYRGLLRYDHADDSMQFWTSSVRRVTIDSSGNVGIGSTNTSGFKLDVAGTARANNLVFRADTSTPSGDAAIFRPATASLALSTNSTERMRIDSSGNVGIGTSTLGSSSKLTVAGSNGTTGLEIIPNDASGEVILQAYERTGSAFRNLGHTASSFTWDIGGGSEAMRIDSAGKVGVGINNPSGSFHVTTKDASGSDVFYVAQNTTANRIAGYRILDESNNIGGVFQYDNGSNNLLIGTTLASSFQFITSNTLAAQIAADGRFTFEKRADFDDLLIGTTAGKYIQVTGSGGTAWTTSSSGGVSTPGTASTEFAFHHWNGSAWSQALGITSDNKITYVSNIQRTDEIGTTAGYGKWINPGVAYVYDATNGTRYLWYKIGQWSNTATGRITIEYEAKDDVNYPDYVRGTVAIGHWETVSFSVNHDSYGQQGGFAEIRVDSNHNVWIRMASITWSHHWRYRIHQANSGFTPNTSWTNGVDRLDSAVHTTPPAGSSDNIMAGDNVRYGYTGRTTAGTGTIDFTNKNVYKNFEALGMYRAHRQPSFYADLSSNITFTGPSSLGTAVPFNREYVDPTSNFNTGNGLFTAPTAGWYMFDASVYSVGGANFQQAWFVVNGARANHTDSVYCNTSYSTNLVVARSMIYLSSGDTVGFHPYNGQSSQTIHSNSHHTYFKGYFLG